MLYGGANVRRYWFIAIIAVSFAAIIAAVTAEAVSFTGYGQAMICSRYSGRNGYSRFICKLWTHNGIC